MKVCRTEFGIANSEHRRACNLKLREVAEFLKVTPAFLTNVEVGRKPVPEEWFDKLVKLYNLDVLQKSMLRHAGFKSQKRFVIEVQNEGERELMAAFMENRECLEVDQLKMATDSLSTRDSEVCKNAEVAH